MADTTRLANRVVKGETGPVILRRLSPDDWLLWREVRLRALEESPDAFGATLSEWSAAGEDRWRSRLGTVPFNVVAVLGDGPVGQASGTELGDDGRVELVSMWVAPEARATQVAGGLVEAVVGWASGVGAQALRLSVRSSNARAIGFYRRLGFDEVDEPGDEASEIAMIRSLDG